MTTVKHAIDGAVGIISLAKPPHALLGDAMVDDLLSTHRKVVVALPINPAVQCYASILLGIAGGAG